MDSITKDRFDYNGLDQEKRVRLRKCGEYLGAALRRGIQEISTAGKHLLEAKEMLDHGEFQEWLRAEFKMSYATALNFMRVHDMIKDNPEAFKNIKPSILYAMAEPGTPESARQEIKDKNTTVMDLSKAEAKRIIAARKAAERKTQPVVDFNKPVKPRPPKVAAGVKNTTVVDLQKETIVCPHCGFEVK